MLTLPAGVVLADTITKLDERSRGAVIVSGSHGGVYPAYLARKAAARALILNDAGVGKDKAGIGSLDYSQQLGMAAVTVAHDSARIGDTNDMLARGRISFVNDLAKSVGCDAAMDCLQAAQLLTQAPLSEQTATPYPEAREVLQEPNWPLRVVCLDSVSLVQPEDAGQIVITGSHGGIVGGKRATALRVDAFAAVYNDAGIGIDQAGISRLIALDERGIAAATVAASSACIGDGRSSLEDGVLSAVNANAEKRGAQVGMTAREFVALLQYTID